MSESNFDFLPLKVVSVGVDGKRRFDEHDRLRLIEACLLPSVSVARMAREAGVNANQLWRWIKSHEAARRSGIGGNATGVEPAAFVPVIRLEGAVASIAPEGPLTRPEPSPTPKRRELACSPSQPAPSARMSATLPNGVVIELQCSGRDASLVSAMIAALGAH
jgi:transposase